MARDFKKEYEQRQQRKNQGASNETTLLINARIPKTLNQDFIAKVELEGVTKSAKIKELIENYIYGEK